MLEFVGRIICSVYFLSLAGFATFIVVNGVIEDNFVKVTMLASIVISLLLGWVLLTG